MLKKVFVILTLVFSLQILTSCSDDGKLVVINKTDAEVEVSVENSYYNVKSGGSITRTWRLSKTIFSSEEKNITISGEGLFKFKFSETRTVSPGNTTNYEIIADAGAISLYNNSNLKIVSVYISPSSDSYWGSDDLGGVLYPGERVYWRVTPGYWDIKIVDENNDSYGSFNNYVYENYLLSLVFYNNNSSIMETWKKTNSDKKLKLKYYNNTNINMHVEKIK